MNQNIIKILDNPQPVAKPIEVPSQEPMSKSKKRRMKKQAKQAAEPPKSEHQPTTIDSL